MFKHVAFVLASRMKRFEESRPLIQRGVEDIVNNLTSDSESEYDRDNSDNNGNLPFPAKRRLQRRIVNVRPGLTEYSRTLKRI